MNSLNLFFYLIEGVFLAAGVLMVFFGIKSKNKERNARQFWEKTTATVISIDSSGDESYFPVYKYFVDSVEYTKRSVISNEKSRIGDSFTVLYNPQNPGEALEEMDKAGGGLMIIGILFIIFSLFAFAFIKSAGFDI